MTSPPAHTVAETGVRVGLGLGLGEPGDGLAVGEAEAVGEPPAAGETDG